MKHPSCPTPPKTIPSPPRSRNPYGRLTRGVAIAGRSSKLLLLVFPCSSPALADARPRFTVKISPPVADGPVTSCNCSICTANGYLMVYPLESNVSWQSGKDDLTTYQFGKERVVSVILPSNSSKYAGKVPSSLGRRSLLPLTYCELGRCDHVNWTSGSLL